MINIIDNLNESISDDKIINCLSTILWSEESKGKVELDEKWEEIPENTKLEVISKSFHLYKYGLGNFFAVQIAVGGVESIQFGILRAKYFFVSMRFSEDGNFITLDVHHLIILLRLQCILTK